MSVWDILSILTVLIGFVVVVVLVKVLLLTLRRETETALTVPFSSDILCRLERIVGDFRVTLEEQFEGMAEDADTLQHYVQVALLMPFEEVRCFLDSNDYESKDKKGKERLVHELATQYDVHEFTALRRITEVQYLLSKGVSF